MSDNIVLFRSSGDLKVGDVYRYRIEYTPTEDCTRECLQLYVFNSELAPLRAAYLNGPFTLYVDMRPAKYGDLRKVTSKLDQPHYNHNLKAGQHFKCDLWLSGKPEPHVWYVDVVGEQLFNRNAVVKHQLVVATTKHAAKSNDDVSMDPQCDAFSVNVKDTRDLWLEPLQDDRQDDPLHLVILTHGLMSNVTADMLYLKEEIDEQARKTGENIVCKGYTGNVCRTEKGVKFLGRRLADWLMFEVIPRFKPVKMSFIAHSLGGLVQSYAIAYIETVHPGFFEKIELVNFITLATPFLGITSENPGYVKMVLDFGLVGKTGRDLGLSWQLGMKKPLLRTLPTGPTNQMLKRFAFRTTYANAVNDGIVPLRTASLLYLDWRAISKATAAKRGSNAARFEESKEDERKHPDSEVASLDDRADDIKISKTHEKHFKGGSTGSTHTVNAITHTVDQMFQWLNPWAPHKVSRHKLRHYQTKNDAGSDKSDESGDEHVPMPKKTSILESGMALMIAPLPNSEFIGDPDKREDVIFHDRVYSPKDLPPRRFRKKLFQSHNDPKEIARGEEKMARAWHRDKDWRKVLVQLLPEAHNNIVVRRRFTNAYGWPVVHHLVTKHFASPNGEEDSSDTTSNDREEKKEDEDTKSERSIGAESLNKIDKLELRERESVDLSRASVEVMKEIVVPQTPSSRASVDLSSPPPKESPQMARVKATDHEFIRADTNVSLASTITANDPDIDRSWFEPSKSDSEASSFHEVYM